METKRLGPATHEHYLIPSFDVHAEHVLISINIVLMEPVAYSINDSSKARRLSRWPQRVPADVLFRWAVLAMITNGQTHLIGSSIA